mmetsp:Transcript_25891/g.56418  ORF Transcript_25891/g.56418 Transcript_25891/m.56418 type:complete len:80 (+) Transcript_25891:106-345(+)
MTSEWWKKADDSDCALCRVFKEGICRDEFVKFDKCFDKVISSNHDESECMPLFDTFRECMARKQVFQSMMKRSLHSSSE